MTAAKVPDPLQEPLHESRARKRIRRFFRGRAGEEGGSQVEMALVSALVYLPMLFGIFEVSSAVYAYNYVSNMAREATRYAAVRGSMSCIISSTFPDCDLGPAGGSNPTTTSGNAALLGYLQRLGAPGINTNNLTVTATWYEASVSNPGNGSFSSTTWPTACTADTVTSTDTYYCNQVGNAVKVTVTYPFSFNIPFMKAASVNLTSTSEMIINE